MNRSGLIVFLAAAAATCGHSTMPAAELGRAESAVGEARASGAEEVPAAALHLRLANENIALAKSLISKDENDRARFVLERAAADANLARGLVHETKAKAEAEQAQKEIQALQSSIGQEGS
jgi:hypothetical protein